MSNITPAKIIALVADAYRLEFRAVTHCGNTRARYRNAKPWVRARNAAVYLITRHTNLEWRETAQIFGFPVNNTGCELIGRLALNVASDMAGHASFGVVIEGIECGIDALHEQEPAAPAKRGRPLKLKTPAAPRRESKSAARLKRLIEARQHAG
jgi:hypothetical protein